MHSPSKTERLWFSHLLESDTLPSSPSPDNTSIGDNQRSRPFFSVDLQMKRRIHSLLARSEVFDNFLQLKFPNLKRVRAPSSELLLPAYYDMRLLSFLLCRQYGLEGGESMLPALDALFAAASRGRLAPLPSVHLAHVCFLDIPLN